MDDLIKIKCPFCGKVFMVKSVPGIEKATVLSRLRAQVTVPELPQCCRKQRGADGDRRLGQYHDGKPEGKDGTAMEAP